MTVQLKQSAALADEKSLATASHILFVLPKNKPAALPLVSVLEARLRRARSKYTDLAKTPLSADLPNGGVASWLVLDGKQNTFQRHTLLRKASKVLLDDQPQTVIVVVLGDNALRSQAAREAFYVLSVNAVPVPTRKSKQKDLPLRTISIHGWKSAEGYADINALVLGSQLTRSLTLTPPNELTPGRYREQIAALAKQQGWKHEEFDIKKLRKLGAGAFVAVAQGSDPQDAAIVHLTYAPKGAKQHVALVGKGICFDTGGHNLKPARYMSGMHEDMNGSAVALGILLAASQSGLPVKIDCWLAIAQNHIGPHAYKQSDVVTALNGTTIEIVHTDAEGRMVLADTLTLASRAKPEFILDFATLTGSMHTALGDRYSGIIGKNERWLQAAVKVGSTVGERVCVLPFDEDYEEDLESDIADIKQCTLEGGADHILAARFLSRFVEHETPWVHVDLSSYNRKGGLGAVAGDVNGFGVSFGLELLRQALMILAQRHGNESHA
ncbi:leucyl aminopeptidase family protein [Methylobacillus arboreus]|uniref:M17 family metallopeptidase n=1 Tax=Methylobacillus arboreus TaxID=755170 RepID=UPI001E48967A|nr:leucyl aminopeptidase family protein [Methylobacillus arboreus]MCB5189163.1 leucyl aminopeptidase family protein [Methylobacillus arboreus]